MIRIKKNPIPPKSLAIQEAINGSYREPDVIRQLRTDFYDKCYICGLKELSDPQVEHLLPHYNRRIKERVFDWNNLFYVCPHCNNIKKEAKYDEKIINCCREEPEISLECVFSEARVEITALTDNEKTRMTAQLIEECFEKRNTGIREAACDYRVKNLSIDMDVLYKTLEKYKKNPSSKRYRSSLKSMLSRESAFAAFKRGYVRKHLDDYPELESYVSISEVV